MAAMQRGSNVSLTREVPGLAGVILGISWDAGSETALDEGLVFATLLCDASGKVPDDDHFVFFNQLSSPDESISQRDAALDGDAEQVEIRFGAIPPEVERIVVCLYVNDGLGAKRSLGQLKSCALRVVNLGTNAELVRTENLAPAFTTESAVCLGEVYRHSGEWKFKVIGQGYSTGIIGIAKDYGLVL